MERSTAIKIIKTLGEKEKTLLREYINNLNFNSHSCIEGDANNNAAE